MQGLGVEVRVRTRIDPSVALGISQGRGLGKVRHLELEQLWIQDKVSSGESEVRKVKSEDNKDDVLTKHVDQIQAGQHMSWTGQSIERGRRELAFGVEQ